MASSFFGANAVDLTRLGPIKKRREVLVRIITGSAYQRHLIAAANPFADVPEIKVDPRTIEADVRRMSDSQVDALLSQFAGFLDPPQAHVW
jgi:hypothetical protein